MKLEIHKKGCNETVIFDLEPTASVDDLLKLLYEEREALLKKVPFSVYEKVVVIHIVDLYSEHFVTKLEPGNLLADYGVNESTQITLDHFTRDNFQSILEPNHFKNNILDSSALNKRPRAHFFREGLVDDSQFDEKEWLQVHQAIR